MVQDKPGATFVALAFIIMIVVIVFGAIVIPGL